MCDRLAVATPCGPEIDLLMDRARLELPGIARNEVARRVSADNPDSFWVIRRKPAAGEGPGAPRGLAAFLMFNENGFDALVRGELDATDPPREALVGQHERPAAIYVWLVHAKGLVAPALSLVMEKLKTPLYRDVDLFARAVTREGSQFNDSLGFRRGLWWDGRYHHEFHHYRRDWHLGAAPLVPTAVRTLAPPPADARPIRIKVAHGIEDLSKAFAVRAVVYIGEQDCPYDEEFDGNDFAGGHLLALAGDEPVGCARIRYFGAFAKLERLAVRAQYRRRGIGRQLVEAATEFVRAKGYDTLYAHAQKRLVPFWAGQGFRLVDPRKSFAFSDFEYVEIVKSVTPPADAIGLGADPFLVIRPEGAWDRPGILERSAERTPQNATA
ncbi:MAG: GNAT family N-acetyltransferase [Bauldia sp.]|nr:GNAT family N-acetyltransferase [Bauldia sp.]